jgi:hypothetical protein
MVTSYTFEGDSFRAEKPQVWAERRFGARPQGWDFDLHPDGERVAIAPEPDTAAVVKQERSSSSSTSSTSCGGLHRPEENRIRSTPAIRIENHPPHSLENRLR